MTKKMTKDVKTTTKYRVIVEIPEETIKMITAIKSSMGELVAMRVLNMIYPQMTFQDVGDITSEL